MIRTELVRRRRELNRRIREVVAERRLVAALRPSIGSSPVEDEPTAAASISG